MRRSILREDGIHVHGAAQKGADCSAPIRQLAWGCEGQAHLGMQTRDLVEVVNQRHAKLVVSIDAARSWVCVIFGHQACA